VCDSKAQQAPCAADSPASFVKKLDDKDVNTGKRAEPSPKQTEPEPS
jgi:hypothetical protein